MSLFIILALAHNMASVGVPVLLNPDGDADSAWALSLLALVPARDPRPNAAPTQRITTFLQDLGRRWPILIAQYEAMTAGGRDPLLDSAAKTHRDRLIQISLRAPAYIADGRASAIIPSAEQAQQDSIRRATESPVGWLDTLATAWSATSGADGARADWLFTHNGLSTLTPVLMRLANTKELPPSVLTRFTDDLLQGARRATLRELHDQLSGIGNALAGALHLARGDTSAALDALHAAADMPTSVGALPAARLWATVAEARRDTTQLLLATTVQLLETGGEVHHKAVLATQQRDVYERYVVVHGVPPDVASSAGTGLSPIHVPPTLEGYLDREFTVLYERPFLIQTREPGNAASPRSFDVPPRLVVVEYITGTYCEGCWHEDRAFQPLTRQYRPEEVVTLAYHYYLPIRPPEDSADARLGRWYPSLGAWRSARQPWNAHRPYTTVIPPRTLVTAESDTLNGAGWVDGQRLRSPAFWTERREAFWYTSAVAAIERERARPPGLTLHQRITVHGDSAQVEVHIGAVQSADAAQPRSDHPLALRLVLLEDTVRLHGGSIRRLYVNAVRAEARSPELPLGIPLSVPISGETSVRYTFNLGQIASHLAMLQHPPLSYFGAGDDRRQAAESHRQLYTDAFPDARDWRMDRSHLYVVAFVQDLVTGAVLQAVRTKVLSPFPAEGFIHNPP